MHVWFNSSSMEAEVLTFLRDSGQVSFDELLEAVFGERPRDVSSSEAIELDAKATLFFCAMGDLIRHKYIVSTPDKTERKIFFRVRDNEEARILLSECQGND